MPSAASSTYRNSREALPGAPDLDVVGAGSRASTHFLISAGITCDDAGSKLSPGPYRLTGIRWIDVEAVLLPIGLALDEQHLLGEAVRRVGLLRVAVPEVVLAERHGRELRVRADGADLDELRDAGQPGLLHQLDAHHRVLVEEAARVLAVGPDPADDRGEVDDDVGRSASASAASTPSRVRRS